MFNWKKKKYLDPNLISYSKFNYKMDQRHKCKSKNYKLLKENKGKYLCDLEVCKDFLEMTQKTWTIKAKNWKTRLHQNLKFLLLGRYH